MVQVVIPYEPRGIQAELHRNLRRWNVVVAHRRSGKTVWAINQLLKDCLTSRKDRPRYAYLAPLLKQAKDIAWDYLKYYSRTIPNTTTNEAELRVDYPNGGRIRLYGCDNPDALRGIYLDGAIMDEYAQMPDSLLGEVIYPALTDRTGYLVLMGTPRGMNHFYRRFKNAKENSDRWFSCLLSVKETKIFNEEQLKEIRDVMEPEDFEQEFNCSWSSATKGAYFADAMGKLRDKNQITKVPHDPMALVDTWWDLGMDDSTAIIYTQNVGREIHIINYYESSDHGLEHYRDVLEENHTKLGYRYGTHTGPFDLSVRELGTGRSRIQTAASMGLKFQVSPRIRSKSDGVNAVRAILPICWIDEGSCGQFIKCLDNYRRKWDADLQVYREKPEHDSYSHGADAAQILGVSHTFGVQKRKSNVIQLQAAGWT